VLPGGGCSLIRRDDVMEVDVRLTLETDDKDQIYAAWKGLRHGLVGDVLVVFGDKEFMQSLHIQTKGIVSE
jgi:hypothetical protein